MTGTPNRVRSASNSSTSPSRTPTLSRSESSYLCQKPKTKTTAGRGRANDQTPTVYAVKTRTRSPKPATEPVSKPQPVLALKKISVFELKQGDIAHVTHHTAPGTGIVSFLYVHLEPGKSGMLAQVKYTLEDDGTKTWEMNYKPHTFRTNRLAYARVLGNNPYINSRNIDEFMENLRREVLPPVRDPSFNCHKWTNAAAKYLNPSCFKLPKSVMGNLLAEIKEKGEQQAALAVSRMSVTFDRDGPIYKFPGYKPLVEAYYWTTQK